ncbi:hypothetical protein MNEG_5706 [Monoraphidium neglectum]|uniref:ShKT domain-containing protein n=1 Tax=Monoraphidium neglectum TaxID=145388 RepID=A0A0D2L5D9_9CHLO|nr:hypothetical protein MNEG_5706 [Monoraphidium neglectum]KIZ02254.1 hypothetical protein MNEG_5706 [Monoraphidium neglectum]|eukprot:XP_013901273.1 hypothetical protein MNEG_5706 [Monoraphidium neglectum]
MEAAAGFAILSLAKACIWLPSRQEHGILEEDADVDDEVADLLQGAGGDPDVLRSRMEARLQQRELFQERSGSEAPPSVVFREVDPFDLWVWLELGTPLTSSERDMLSSALKSWFVIGKLGGYNSGNLQARALAYAPGLGRDWAGRRHAARLRAAHVYHNSAGDLSYLVAGADYDNSELRRASDGVGGGDESGSAMASFMHEMGDPEFNGNMARFRCDMGTADEVALDVLINLLVGFSRDVAAVARITFGGDQLNGWARAAGGGDARAPPKVGINPMRLPDGVEDEMDLMHELDSMQTDIDEHIKRNGREAGPGDAEAAGGGVPGPLGAARARSGLGWSRGPAAAAAAAEEGPAEPGAQLPRDGGAPKAGRPAGGRRAGGTAAPPGDAAPLAAQPARASLELLCVDRANVDGGCHQQRCQQDNELRFVSCKATCGTCELLRAAIAADTGLAVRIVQRLGSCRDTRDDCADLGRAGSCLGDADSMVAGCQATCGYCTTEPTSGGAAPPGAGRAPCSDDLSLCPFLAQQKLLCPTGGGNGSSGGSGGGGGGGGNSTGAVSAGDVKLLPLVDLRELEGPSACRDYHEQCSQWAAAGQCGSNPGFMQLHCKASCNPCGRLPGAQTVGAAPTPAQVLAALQQAQRVGRQQAAGGAAAGAGGIMLHVAAGAAKPAAAHVPGPGVATLSSTQAVQQDDAWHPFSVCGPNMMVSDASVDCTAMDKLETVPCKDDKQECTVWEKRGECRKNAAFMHRNCKASCHACTTYYYPSPYEFRSLGPPGNKTRERLRAARQAAAEASEDPAAAEKAALEDQSVDPEETLNVVMPSIGLGTAGLGEFTAVAVAAAINKGYLLFDTAVAREWYREDLVGRGVRQGGVAREGLFLTSKIHPRDLGRGATRKALRRALRDLRTDYIDLLLIHYPRCSDGLGCKKGGPASTWQESWREMETMYAEGRARAIGVSNFEAAELLELLAMAKVKPAVLQVHVRAPWAHSDPLESNGHLLNICLERGVTFVSYSLLGTQWPVKPGEPNPVLSHPVIEAIAKEVERTPAQV